MLFSSPTNARKCATSLREASSDPENTPESDIIHFYAPADPDSGFKSWSWASFSAVLMPDESCKKAMAFWRDTGSGLSTRHAEFCLEVLDYLSSESSNKEFCTRALKRNEHRLPQSLALVEATEGSVDDVKPILARIATSEKPGQPTVSPDDVFLYPTGMNSIFSLSESLLQLEGGSSVAAFGLVVSLINPLSLGTGANGYFVDGYIQRQSKSYGLGGGKCFHINSAQRENTSIWRSLSSLGRESRLYSARSRVISRCIRLISAESAPWLTSTDSSSHATIQSRDISTSMHFPTSTS